MDIIFVQRKQCFNWDLDVEAIFTMFPHCLSIRRSIGVGGIIKFSFVEINRLFHYRKFSISSFILTIIRKVLELLTFYIKPK